MDDIHYSFRTISLRKGRKRLVLDIEEENYSLLSSFINVEVPNFSDYIEEELGKAESGGGSFGGNVFTAEFGKDETLIEEQFSENDNPRSVRVPTKLLKQMINDYNRERMILKEEKKMTKDDCIFCKLANGVFPTNTVYEDDDFRVILDASPAAKGHSLIIPKQHADNLYEVDDTVAEKILPLAKRIALSMKKTFNCDGVNVLQNNEPAAGQTVFHLHVHVIPRYNDDGLGLTWKQNETDAAEQAELAESLASNM